MAEADLKHYLTCPVCLETLTKPVSLSCNHSFCYSCLQEYFEKYQTRNCPVCRRKSSKDFTIINFALNALCESFTARLKVSEGATSRRPEELLSELQGFGLKLHSELQGLRLKWKTRRPEELLSEIQRLRAEEQSYADLERTYDGIVQFNQKQAAQCERRIRAEFSWLQSFLQDKEQRTLSALREEQLRNTKKMDQELQEVREKLSSLSTSIKELEKHLSTAPPQIPPPSQSPAPPQSSAPPLRPKAGLLLDQAKVLGNLGFRVWSHMRSMVSYSPVVLDPNTASRTLYLSEDLTGVRYEDRCQEVPDNPERFSRYSTVLGSEGFSSGVHQWDVEVGDHPSWTIGVSRESVDREGERSGSPENGIWALFHRNGEYCNGLGVSVPVKKLLQKVRVKLDYHLGQVFFCNAEDMTLLLSHSGTFTEKLFPYFNVADAQDAQTKELRVLSSDPQTLTL